jgi:myosin protein heavy chain
MSAPAPNGPKWRNGVFNRASPSPATALANGNARPVSGIMSSPRSSPAGPGHARHQSFSPLTALQQAPGRASSIRKRSNSYKNTTPGSGTFAPTFIKSEQDQKPTAEVDGIEGENDFSGKRYVWVKDGASAFQKAWVVEELGSDKIVVQCDDGSVI